MLSLNEIEIIKQQAFACVSSQFKNICTVRPFTVRQYLEMNPITYSNYLGLLLINKKEIKQMIENKLKTKIEDDSEIKPLSFLLENAEANNSFFIELTNAFNTFINEEVLLLPKIHSVVVGDFKDKKLITDENFFDFQEILMIQNRKEIPKPPPENESAGQRKMRLLAEKREAVKKKQQQKEGGKGMALSELLEVATVYGISLDNSIYGFYQLIERYRAKEKWDRDTQFIIAGAKPEELNTKYWGESFNEK